MTVRARTLAWLVTCPLGQACSPLVYELAGETDSDTPGHHGDTDPTDKPPWPATDPTETPGETGPPPPTCGDGERNGDETSVDCGGPLCPPCGPGDPCDGPKDCQLGVCLDGVCQKPVCLGPLDCPPAGDPCLQPICTPDGTCALVPLDDAPCSDDDPCTFKELCKAGACVPSLKLDCTELDGPCRAGVCNPQSGTCAVEWLFEGQPCKDDLPCSEFAECHAGECVAKQPPGPLLFTDFSLLGGWTADPPWTLGPAEPSLCSPVKANDPADDHSPSGDDHVAGAAIGGCLPVDPFAEVCLTSPPIETMFMPGGLWLDYWSVLNTAGAPMTSRVEVHDGNGWKPVESFDSFTVEGTWTEHSVDLSPFKGPIVQVRFCHSSAGASEPVGGWSIDDLSIGAPQCL